MTSEQLDRAVRTIEAQPLCREALLESRDGVVRRCVVAALLKGAGLSDLALERLDRLGYGGDEPYLWRRYGSVLEQLYGLRDAWDLKELMNANDDVEEAAERTRVVVAELRRMAHGGPKRQRPLVW